MESMAVESFTFVDVIVVAVVLLSAILAAMRGFVRESLAIIAWVAAIFAALRFGPLLTPLLQPYLTGWLATLSAYALIFLVVVVVLSFISYRFSQNVRESPIGPVDRGLGIVFGAVRGLVIVALCYLGLTRLVWGQDLPHWMREARSLALIQSSEAIMLSILPDQPFGHASAPAAAMAAQPSEAVPVPHRRLTDDAPAKPAMKKPKKSSGKPGDDAISKLIEANGGGQSK